MKLDIMKMIYGYDPDEDVGKLSIVINKCFGGFSLSEKAVQRLRDKHKMDIPEGQRHFGNGDFGFFPEDVTSEDVYRSDPRLVEVVRFLGKEANSTLGTSDLKIVEIPFDVDWQIEEYDGVEHISEIHRTWS